MYMVWLYGKHHVGWQTAQGGVEFDCSELQGWSGFPFPSHHVAVGWPQMCICALGSSVQPRRVKLAVSSIPCLQLAIINLAVFVELFVVKFTC